MTEDSSDVFDIQRIALTMQFTVELLNQFMAFFVAAPDSPQEDQDSKGLEDKVKQITDADLAGDVLLSLCALILEVDEPEKVQAFLNMQTEAIQAEIDRHGH